MQITCFGQDFRQSLGYMLMILEQIFVLFLVTSAWFSGWLLNENHLH